MSEKKIETVIVYEIRSHEIQFISDGSIEDRWKFLRALSGCGPTMTNVDNFEQEGEYGYNNFVLEALEKEADSFVYSKERDRNARESDFKALNKDKKADYLLGKNILLVNNKDVDTFIKDNQNTDDYIMSNFLYALHSMKRILGLD